jgi:hypothetical protein
MSRSDTAKLREQIEEAKLRLSDLTRELDESMRAEDEETVQTELQRARDRVVELERLLEDAEGA